MKEIKSRDMTDRFCKISFIVEYVYLSFICILVIRHFQNDNGYFGMYFSLMLDIVICIFYFFILYVFSGKGKTPTIVEVILRYLYLVVAGCLLAKTNNASVQVIIILPTVIMALRYSLKYTVLTASLTTVLFLIVANVYQNYEYDYQFVFVGFIWVIGLLVNSAMEFERQMREERIKIKEKQKLAAIGQMAAAIAHEIRNPLTTIKGFIHLLTKLESKLTVSERKEYLKIIDVEIERLNGLLKEFVQYAKPVKPQLNSVNINKIIDEMKNLLETQCYGNNIKMVVNMSINMPNVLCDSDQIKQVIINMALNAIDAMEKNKNKVLELGTFYDFKNIYIRIKDTGMGICPELKEKLFEPFFTTKDKGTGLGLSVCNTIIRNHAGHIMVDSSPDGTEFLIALPRKM